MRSTAFAALAMALLAAGPALADSPAGGQGGAGGQPGQPAKAGKPGQPGQPPGLGGAQPGRPGAGVGVPGAPQGFPPGFPPGAPFDPQKMREMALQNIARGMGLRVPPTALKWGGMLLEPADATLQEQLNLPTGKGMVVTDVEADSAAAKAGLKKHDLIVKLNEQAVPGDARELLKTLGDGKGDAPVDLALLRKGKEQTLKGIKLPEAALAGGPMQPGVGGVFVPPAPPIGGAPVVPPPFPAVPGLPGAPAGVGIGVQVNVLDGRVSVNRNNDKFDGDYQKDKLHITVRGKIENNQTKVEQITVDDGSETKKYQKVEEVPQVQRTIVQRLLQMVNGNGGGNFPNIPPPLLPGRPGFPGGGGAPPVPPGPGLPGRG